MLQKFNRRKGFASAFSVTKANPATESDQVVAVKSFNYRIFAVTFLVLTLLAQSLGLSLFSVNPVANAASPNTDNLSQSLKAVGPRFIIANTYYANQLTDDAGGTSNTVCTNSSNTTCSLRSALQLAQTDNIPTPRTNRDQVIVKPGSTYNLTTALITTGGAGGQNIPDKTYLTSVDVNSVGSNVLPCQSQSNVAIISGGNTVGGLSLGSNDTLIGLNVTDFINDGVVINGTSNTLTCDAITSNAGNGVNIASGATSNKIGGIKGSTNSTFYAGGGAEILIGSNGGAGVLITGTATANTVENAAIGYSPAGNLVGNAKGIVINGGANNNQIGSNVSTLSNTISDNSNGGILISGSGSNNNTVEGNYIGTNSAGSTNVGNGNSSPGVRIDQGASGNTIGGAYAATLGYGNLISGNQDGVVIDNAGSNYVQGNFIGTNVGGTTILANIHDGIILQNGAASNIIGSNSSTPAGNVIGGNGNDGIYITNTGTNNNAIYGNRIGTNAATTAALPNAAGVVVDTGPTGTIIGGSGSNQLNVISGNSVQGVLLTGSVSNTQIVRNNIGTDINGDYRGVTPSSVAISNTLGVVLASGVTSTTINQNVVAFNNNEGISVANGSNFNTITQNSIYGNGVGSLGIFLASGANSSATPPIISVATITTTNNTYSAMGTATAGSTVEVFLARSVNSGTQQGLTFFGSTIADGSGNFLVSGNLPTGFSVPGNPQIVATTTLASDGSTSEFSAAFAPFVKTGVSITPTTLNFNFPSGSTNASSQTATLSTNLTTINISDTVTYNSGSNWLTIVPLQDTIPVNPGSPVIITATVNPTGLSTGTYSATVDFIDNASSNVVATLTVSVVIAAPPTTTPTGTTPTVTGTTPTVTGTTPTVTGTTPTVTGTTPTITTTPPITGTTYTYYLPFLANAYSPGSGVTGSFTTFLAFQNTGSGTANVNIQYFDVNGVALSGASVVTTTAKYGETIASNPFATGAHGTGIITSNQPLAVIVSEATPYGGSAYAVNAGASNMLNAPFAYNNTFGGYSTQLTVFNTGSSAVNATVNFYDVSGTQLVAATKTVTVGAKQNVTLDQAATGSNIPTGFNGWAQITSPNGSQLVAQVLEQNPGIRYVSIVNAQSTSSTNVYAPAMFNAAYGNFITGASIVNPNNKVVTVTLTYYNLTGTASAATPFTIPAFGLVSIYQGSTSAGTGIPGNGLPNGFAGAATVSSVGGGVIMAVNEFGGYTSGGTTESGTYSAASSGASVVGLPVIANNGFGYTTGTTVFNISNQTVTGNLQYYNLNGTAQGAAKSFSIAPNASAIFYQGDPAQGLTNFYGTAVLTQTGGTANSLIDTTNAVSANFFYTYVEPTQ
jgi:hypothetical protein